MPIIIESITWNKDLAALRNPQSGLGLNLKWRDNISFVIVEFYHCRAEYWSMDNELNRSKFDTFIDEAQFTGPYIRKFHIERPEVQATLAKLI